MQTAILEGTGLTKRFGAFQALDAVTVSVTKGEALGIVGPNGAGKSTLFGVLAGALPPTNGAVRFEGHNVTNNDAAQRCRLGIARTHQVPRPFLGMSVFENALVAAAYGSALHGEDAEQAAVDALSRSGLLPHADRPAATLGLLDRKRLEVARALATQPQVILFDEIGGGLTEAELVALIELVQGLKSEGMTIVWIEHILHALLKVVDRLVCMAGGGVIAEGDPRAVMADETVMRAYLGGLQ